MDTERRIALALRKQRLLLRSAELRGRIGAQAQPLLPLFAAADRLRGGWLWLRRHPAVPVAVFTALLVARPRGVLRWLQRGWLLWQMSARLRAGVASAAPVASAGGGILQQLGRLRRWLN
jgi:hypothetical protein